MKQIGSLFEKYRKTLRPPQATVEMKVLSIISDITHVDLRDGQVSYNVATKTLQVTAPSVIKSELFRRKRDLLEAFRAELGDGGAPVEII